MRGFTNVITRTLAALLANVIPWIGFADSATATVRAPPFSAAITASDEQAVGGDVEEFGEADDGFDGRGDLAVLVAAWLWGLS